MKMRKSALMAVIVLFCLVLTGCSREFQKKDEEIINSETKSAEESFVNKQSEVMAKEIADEMQTENNRREEEIINLIERDKYEPTESWTVEMIENMIPIVPEGYEGILVDYVMPYTGKDGVEIQLCYEDVAFVAVDSEYIDYDKYYITSDIIDIDGEQKSGFFLCEREVLNFLEHKKGEEVESFYLDINIPETYYMHVMARNDQKVLIWNGGSYLFTYNFESEKCSLITDSALDFNSPVGDELYFTDWEHTEYVCNWLEDNGVVETGKKVVTYFYNQCEVKPIDDETRQTNFLAIQQAAKDGYLDKAYMKSKGYEIYDDYLYDFGVEKGFSGSIHLPYASDETGYAVYGEFMSCWEIDRNQLYLYRYGDRVRQYVLDEGNWCIIDSTLGVTKKLFNGDVDDQVSAEELNQQIATVDVLLLNTSEKCLYHLSDIEGYIDIRLIAENVCDCYASYEDSGIAHWLDDNNCAYEVFWVIDEPSILIGENAVGIAKVKGEQAGFIVKPGDPRCNATRNGINLCTMYGHDWLNQDQTSGAWALEYDWD